MIKIIMLVTLAYALGAISYKYHLPPYSVIKTIYNNIYPREQDEEFDRKYNEAQFGEIISIRNQEDLTALKSRLVSFLWGSARLPQSLPASVQQNFIDSRYADIQDLLRIDKLIVQMEFGIESSVYHFIPKKPNNRLVLFHQGHEGDFFLSKNLIAQFLAEGYSVTAFAMPLFGLNNQPVVTLSRFGRLKLSSHDRMKFLLGSTGHPIKYFVEPVVVALNYLKHNYRYRHIAMVGISGGGWTTTLAAAIDSRIAMSFPVAGSYPISLRSESSSEWGDWEQNEPRLYEIANYLELYILGAYGNNRKQLQMLNKYDACCFRGNRSNTYKNEVRSRVNNLGLGEFDVFLDETHHDHKISEAAMRRIIIELAASKDVP